MSPDLSPRELRVLELVSAGETNNEIAAALCLSAETIKSHMKHVFWKLDAKSRPHAVAIAFRRGLLR